MSYQDDINAMNQTLQTYYNQQAQQQSIKLAEDDLEFGKEAFNQQMGLANEQFDWNKKVADRNYEFQKTQWEYQKQLNNLAMQREDSAFQRARADLEKAGLSPLMLSNGAGAQALNAGIAPQYDVSGVNTAYGAKQDALERRRQQLNANRQFRFEQKQANRQLALQSTSMALQVEKQVIDNIKSSQEIERNAHQNKFYREHGYQQLTLATVLSDFLNRDSTKKLFDSVSGGYDRIVESINNIKLPEPYKGQPFEEYVKTPEFKEALRSSFESDGFSKGESEQLSEALIKSANPDVHDSLGYKAFMKIKDLYNKHFGR